MQPNPLAFALPLFATAALTSGLAIYAFRRSGLSGAVVFGLVMTATSIWVLFYGVELLMVEMPGKVLAAKLQYLGITALPPLWLVFALIYTGHEGWLTRRKKILLAIPSALTLGLALTNEAHSLIWLDVGPDPNANPQMFFSGHGVGFWVFAVISYILILIGFALFVQAFLRAARPFRQQMALMLLGGLAPLAGNVLSLTSAFSGTSWLDPTPFFFAASGVLLALGLFRFGLLDILPVAAPAVIEHLQDAVLVIDSLDRIIELNPAAHRLFGVDAKVIGCDLLSALQPEELARKLIGLEDGQTELSIGEGKRRSTFQLSISPIHDDRNQLTGRILVLRDITHEHALLDAERRRTRQAALLNEITQTALRVADFHDMIQLLTERLAELIEADGAFITIWDELQQRTIPTVAYNEMREPYSAVSPEPGEATMTKAVLSTGRTLVIEDVLNTPYLSPRLAALFPSRSALTLPLISGERKLGAAIIAYNTPHVFTPEEIGLCEQAAAQVALAMAQAQLLDTQRHHIEQHTLLTQIADALMTVTEDDLFWSTLMDSACLMLSADRAAVYLYDRNADRVSCPFSSGLSAEYVAAVNRLFHSIPGGRLLSRPEPVRVTDAQTDPETAPLQEHVLREGFHSYAIFPLPAPDGAIGAFVVYRDDIRPFSDDDTVMGQTLARLAGSAFQNLRLLESEREQRRLADALREANLALSRNLDFDVVLDDLLDEIKKVVPYDSAAVMLVEHTSRDASWPQKPSARGLGRARVVRTRGYEQFGENVAHDINTRSFEIATTVNLRKMVESHQPMIVPDTAADPDWIKVVASEHVRSWAGAPILARGQVLAFFALQKTELNFYRPEHVERLAAFAGQAAIVIENARLHAEVKTLSVTDSLTGLANRRAFDRALEREFARTLLFDQPLSLIILDVDSFKQYNDTYGHIAGDRRLHAIGSLLLENVREHDLVARYGGEEFAIIMPYTSKAGAIRLAGRIRSAAEVAYDTSLKNPSPGDRPQAEAAGIVARQPAISRRVAPGYTLSLGVSAFPDDAQTTMALLLAADNAELMAKRLGKNRVCAAGGE